MATSKEKEKLEEMEKSMSEDAIWKRIQKNTFTRWANEHLKTVNKTLSDLETDFADGIRFVALVEVLAGKKVPYKYHKRPTMRSHKLENVYTGLKFLTDDEGLRLVNIDSVDVVDCKLKLILGLMWTLILHYSISLPMWEDDADNMLDTSAKTPKQRLLRWIQSKIPDMSITNFTNDWNDGRAVGALVDALAPGLCPNWQKWDPKNAEANAKEAMDKASEWLGVPQLLDPKEMTNPKVDELSMMTYLSQFPNAKLKDGAPIQMETNPKRVRCYGPGIEPTGVCYGAPTSFTIETFSAGAGDVKVEVTDPKGKKIPADVKFNDDKSKTYTVTYAAQCEGPHKVTVKFAGEEVPKSPFNVEVKGFAGDPSKVICNGPGLKQSGLNAQKPTFFEIDTKDAGPGQIEVVIVDPQGNKDRVPCRVTKTSDTTYKCEYCPTQPGTHSLNVLFCGKPVPKSPFGIRVGLPVNARKCRLSGRGLVKRGVRIGDVGDFKMYTENCGQADPEIEVFGPDGKKLKVEQGKIDDTTYEFFYEPVAVGQHKIVTKYGGDETPKSPYEVNVGPFKESKIRVYGPGLKGGVVDFPCCFTVDTNGETASLGFTIEGPSQAKIECTDNGDGSAGVKFNPTAPGDYVVHITTGGEDIPKSPYICVVIPQTDYDPLKVTASGPGLKPGVEPGKVTEFVVDATQAKGFAPLDIQIHDENYDPVKVKIHDNKDKTYRCTYTPKNDKCVISINYGGVAIPGSPFKVAEPDDGEWEYEDEEPAA